MTINPTTTSISNHIKQLPGYVCRWITNERHQDLSEIVSIKIAVDYPYGWNVPQFRRLTYKITFANGYTAEQDFTPYWEDCGPLQVRIVGYNEAMLPNWWIHRYIMGGDLPDDLDAPQYEQDSVAYGVVMHLLKRGKQDPLFVRFARKLVNDETVSDGALVVAVQMGLFAMSYSASQICTAAYLAYHELELEQINIA